LCKIARANETLFEQNFQAKKKKEKQQELESGKGDGEILNNTLKAKSMLLLVDAF
jgi:hypothetical protein